MTKHKALISQHSLSLLTDLYQLTMAYGYWKSKTFEKQAVFHLFFRTIPFSGGFAIASGLQAAAEFIEGFKFDESDLSYLKSLTQNNGSPLFDEGFLQYLRDFKFAVDVDAVPEGTVVFPYEPLLRIQGPLLNCQLLETPLLNLINFPSLIATKAARLAVAAKGDEVVEFGLRRAQGIDGALTASRASFVGGCASTSNVLAGKLFGIPVKGTHAHSWIMSFDTELESFYAYANEMPDNCVFLVDTYDTLQGVKNAIIVGKKMREQGKKMLGIRLDSGDLLDLSIEARKLLDADGFLDAKIMASNELDEFLIESLKEKGTKVTVWGVGTHLVTGKGQSALDGVYKLSAIRTSKDAPWDYKMKLSEKMQKISMPGILQVRRIRAGKENIRDIIYNVDKTDGNSLGGFDLLEPIFREGKLVYSLPELKNIQLKTKEELGFLSEGVKRLKDSERYPIELEQSLTAVKDSLTAHGK